jgi:hypothetical protein
VFLLSRAGGEGDRPGLRRRFHRPHGLGLTCCSCRRTPCHWVSNHLYPAGRVGLRFSKVRVPGDGGEALVPASLWNKSSLTLPLPVGILLRCRRRVSGGGVPFVNSLFRSSGLAVQRCLWVAVSSAFFVKVAERRWMSSSTPLKAAGRWGFSRSQLCSSSSAAAVVSVGVGDAELRQQAQDLGA